MTRRTTKTLDQLLIEHRNDRNIRRTERLIFHGVDGHDVYNISQPFSWGGVTYLAGRVERRDSEQSDVRLFERMNETSYRATDVRFPNLQDPFVTVLEDSVILGGTEIDSKDNRITGWRTVAYRGESFAAMSRVLTAPEGMKDVRVCWDAPHWHIFTRPQGGVAGKGTIGYLRVSDLRHATPERLAQALLLDTLFEEHCWGGVNQVFVLDDRHLGIVGHIATMSEGDVRHYYGMTFVFDHQSQTCSDLRIVCERSDFAPGEHKRDDLKDVVFLGGMIRHDDHTATLYTGLSDAEAHLAVVDDPFSYTR